MTFRLSARRIEAVLLDIEGTTTPIAFVYDVLFPYARAHLGDYLRDQGRTGELAGLVRQLRGEWDDDVARGREPPPWQADDREPAAVARYVEWLMDRDRKSSGLKTLQGKIWERGYRDGALKGEVFADVPAALQQWRAAGIDIAIYSSGSVLAQRLLFSSTAHGDLTRCISAFFDTTIGPKSAPDSYRRIAADWRHPTAAMLFVSDTRAELDAARAAGLETVLCVRPGNQPQTAAGLQSIRGLDEIGR